MATWHDLGKLGEQIAVEWLQLQGYCILERNWRYHRAEVDIIAQKGQFLIFVEVKTRRSERHGSPADFVGPKKQRFMASAASAYAAGVDFPGEIRFDVACVLYSGKDFHLEYLEDAFFPG